MKYQIFSVSSIFLAGWLMAFSAFASPQNNEFQQANRKYYQLLAKNKETRVTKEQWFQLINQFEKLHQVPPSPSQAPYALFRMGQLYRALFHTTNQYVYINRSLRAFRHLIKHYPKTTLRDDSQLIIGEIFEEEKQDLASALAAYNKVLNMYDGDQRARALLKIRQLRENSTSPALPSSFSSTQKHSSSTKKKQGGISLDQSRVLPKAEILSAQYWATPNWVKIVINASRPIPYLYNKFLQYHPNNTEQTFKFHIDLLDSQLQNNTIASLLNEQGSFIHDVVLKRLNHRITRLNFLIDLPVTLTIYDYELSGQHVITLELFPQKPLTFAGIQQSEIKTLDKPTPITRRIVIDPGHGGQDPGASGFGIHEKDIVLSIGKELKKLLEDKTAIEVFLTRNNDQFVSLETRSALAKQYKGDLFVSLHVNAHPQEEVKGIESYYLDVTNNQTSVRLAMRENKMSNQGFENFNIILRDLLSASYSSQSTLLAHSIHSQLIQNIRTGYHSVLRDLGVKEAPFLLLLGVGMPAILIEISFITNREENDRLRDKKYHTTVAEGIYNGIHDYLLQEQK
ncbi:MAG: N-acetylmuramoyl-L-alanine amidase [SAR324 cluster bacterium]|nr:N-acetylmuramoyl-L-alanine amidase [SAR324 cluster bacterium]